MLLPFLAMLLPAALAHADFTTPKEAAPVLVRHWEVEGTKASLYSIQQPVPRSLAGMAKARDFARQEILFHVKDAAQFTKLAKRFVWPGLATPPAGKLPREVNLNEFLPEVAQALVGKRWLAVNRAKLEEQPVSANCWATAYEVSRLSRSGVRDLIINEDRDLRTEEKFNDPAYFRPIFEADFANKYDLPSPDKLAAVQPGDVILLYGSTEILPGSGRFEYGLVHAAIYVGEGLYFEKFSESESGMYRLTKYEDMVRTRFPQLPAKGSGGGGGSGGLMRWVRSTGKDLPPLTEILDHPFNVASAPSHRDIPLDENGLFPHIYRVVSLNDIGGRTDFPALPSLIPIEAKNRALLQQGGERAGKACSVPAGTKLEVEEVIGFWNNAGATRVVLRSTAAIEKCECVKSQTGICELRNEAWSVHP